jgi:hypothetical protein
MATTSSLSTPATRSLTVKKRRQDLHPVIDDIRKSGAACFRQIAAGLNERGITTARGREWFAIQVKWVLAP